MGKKNIWGLLSLLTTCCLLLSNACSPQRPPLVVYAGKGLQKAMQEVETVFEREYHTELTIIYAGSNSLLKTITKTRKGDVFVPGSLAYIDKAGELVTSHRFVARHIPVFALRADNPKGLSSYYDLTRTGIKIAVGNKDMCAIGKLAEKIINPPSGDRAEFAQNIVITGSTVNELLNLVLQKEVDAAMVWADMLQWPEAEELVPAKIPAGINRIKEIHVAVLSTTTSEKQAAQLLDFMATTGREIFLKHGFGD